jgi:hypothetical protein
VTGCFSAGSDTGKAADIAGCYGEGALNGRYTAAASYRAVGRVPTRNGERYDSSGAPLSTINQGVRHTAPTD